MLMIWPIVKPLLRSKFGLMVIAVGALAYFSGFNPLSLIGMGGNSHSSSMSKKEEATEAAFVKTVLADIEDVWSVELPKQLGLQYKKPIMVLYRGSTRSGCGHASAQMGPFYCPVDQKVYLDLGFFDELARRHDAPGDFAQAYVLAHEIGHHIQNLQGTLDEIQHMKQQVRSQTQANHLQVRVELQADCYAGVWAHFAQTRLHILQEGDIEEALNAASKIGDDTLQKEATGRVMPDGFTHGTSKQRVAWFKHGFLTGSLKACNTFK
jgi:predicted metalloprotease